MRPNSKGSSEFSGRRKLTITILVPVSSIASSMLSRSSSVPKGEYWVIIYKIEAEALLAQHMIANTTHTQHATPQHATHVQYLQVLLKEDLVMFFKNECLRNVVGCDGLVGCKIPTDNGHQHFFRIDGLQEGLHNYC